jgi:hypothetical protein
MRFPPGGVDDVKKVRNEAKYAHRHHQETKVEPWYRLSVWADIAGPEEAEIDVLRRLVKAARLANLRVDEPHNAVFWTASAQALYQRGFSLVRDQYPDEPAEHYSVDLGKDEPSRQIVESFVSAFDGPKQTGLVTA